MEKKAKEMEATITDINQVNKETQMKLNSCEFNLQIKEHEVVIVNIFVICRIFSGDLKVLITYVITHMCVNFFRNEHVTQ